MKTRKLSGFSFMIFFLSLSGIFIPAVFSQQGMKPVDIFNKPGTFAARDLYKIAHETFTAGDLDGARLIALRIFLDGHRSQNLLDLLGAIEIKANRPLFAGEWLRKAICINPDDSVARKIMARLPKQPRPIPMEAAKLADHFAAITRKLPTLLARLTSQKLHSEAIFDEIERGQFYKALALSEEYEKRYPGPDGSSLTALCAFYLGRTSDALQLVTAVSAKEPLNPVMLFVKAMISDTNSETSSSSRAKALFDEDKWAEAIQAADKITQIFPRTAEGILVKARIAIEGLKIDEASALLDEAAARDSDHPVLEVLQAEISLLRNNPDKATDQLNRAYKRGYNLPSVSLKAGLLAALAGRKSDGEGLLAEFKNCLPFIDRDSYPLFTRLAIEVGDLPLAQKTIEGWKARFKPNSELFFCEAFYHIKAGDGLNALRAIRKAMELNPDRLIILRELSGFQIFDVDPELAREVQEKLRKAGEKAAPKPQKAAPANPVASPAAAVPLPVNPQPEPPVAGSDTAAAQPRKGSRFKMAVPSDVAQETAGLLEQNLNTSLDRAEGFFGLQAKTINVQLITISAGGSKVADYDFAADRLKLSTLFADQANLKTALDQERPDLDPDQIMALIQSLPQQTLTEEMCSALLAQRVKNIKANAGKISWLIKGIGQIVGAESEVLKDRLKFTQSMIASGQLTLLNTETVNKIFSATSYLPGEMINAYTHSYLMVAFLLKKAGNLQDGSAKFLKLIEEVCAGKTLDKALMDTFKVSQEIFESGWKESAYWSLQQGMPYEW